MAESRPRRHRRDREEAVKLFLDIERALAVVVLPAMWWFLIAETTYDAILWCALPLVNVPTFAWWWSDERDWEAS